MVVVHVHVSTQMATPTLSTEAKKRVNLVDDTFTYTFLFMFAATFVKTESFFSQGHRIQNTVVDDQAKLRQFINYLKLRITLNDVDFSSTAVL